MESSTISVNECVERCNNQTIAMNSSINAVTVNGLQTTSICWCLLSATIRRHYKTCLIGNIFSSGLIICQYFFYLLRYSYLTKERCLPSSVTIDNWVKYAIVFFVSLHSWHIHWFWVLLCLLDVTEMKISSPPTQATPTEYKNVRFLFNLMPTWVTMKLINLSSSRNSQSEKFRFNHSQVFDCLFSVC